MPSYRFCRSDDIPLLVQAYNTCYSAFDPDGADWSVEEFKLAVRRFDLWTSSCMVAQEGDEIIGILLAAKRDTANLVHRVGVKPAHRRRGHARHMLDSLSAKLAILGPRRMLAEVPATRPEARAFIEAAGYRSLRVYTDFTRPAVSGRTVSAPPSIVLPITLDDLSRAGVLAADPDRCWVRAPESLRRLPRTHGWAVVPGERVEAHLLYHDAESGVREILAFGVADPEHGTALLELLFRHGCAAFPVRIRQVHPGEIAFERLESWGFEPGAVTIGYEREARPA